MPLSDDLISQFVKATKDEEKPATEEVVYGTAKVKDNNAYVIIDGSSIETPAVTTTAIRDGERVLVTIKGHKAIITGNTSSPSPTTSYVDNGDNKVISDVELLLSGKVSTKEFDAEKARIDDLEAENATIKETLEASEVVVGQVIADNVEINRKLVAAEGDIDRLETGKLDASTADIKYAAIKDLEATNARVHTLESTYGDFADLSAIQADIEDLKTDKLDSETAKLTYANIDFSNIGEAAIRKILADSGLIENVVIGDGTITGELVGVTIKGDLIEGNTVVADKLVIKGTDGLYYKLNTDGVKTEAEQTDYNSLNGTVIKAKSITASKISVDDLVAFDATIGGFNISESSIYSGTKSSVDNTTTGIYLDRDGQMAIGDGGNYLKYYKDQNGSYKLIISASSVLLGASNKSVETAINDVQKSVDDIKIGGENLYVKSASFDSDKWINTAAWAKDGTDSNGNARIKHGTWAGLYQFIEVKAGDVYTLSANVSGDGVADFRFYGSLYSEPSVNSTVILGVNPAHSDRGTAPLEEQRFRQTFTITEDGYLRVRIENGISDSYIWVSSIKLERGNKSTDWSPAPSDMATEEDMQDAKSLAETADEKADNATALIKQLADNISMLVTDGNGTSLMTQTEDGWTFSTADIQTVVNAISENLNDVSNDLGDVNNTVSVLQEAVDDLGVLADYVKITTYEDEPCIELGEGDSDFKLLITNTRIMFKEGSGVPAYFNNQSMFIKKAVIEEELQQGGFVWKIRSNGNMGLTWKGGIN